VESETPKSKWLKLMERLVPPEQASVATGCPAYTEDVPKRSAAAAILEVVRFI
jgi:hypothetical protein